MTTRRVPRSHPGDSFENYRVHRDTASVEASRGLVSRTQSTHSSQVGARGVAPGKSLHAYRICQCALERPRLVCGLWRRNYVACWSVLHRRQRSIASRPWHTTRVKFRQTSPATCERHRSHPASHFVFQALDDSESKASNPWTTPAKSRPILGRHTREPFLSLATLAPAAPYPL